MSTEPTSLATGLLLRRWHSGDEKAFEALLIRHLPWLQAYVHRRLGDLLRARAETGDYVQEAMIDALRYGPRVVVADDDQFRALLGRIVENVLRDQNDHFRAKKRDAKKQRDLPQDSILALDAPQKDVTRPSMVASREEEKAWLELALECLPTLERRLIQMRDFDAAPFAEIGKGLGIAEDAARMRYRRAVLKLAERVEEIRRGGIRDALARAAEEKEEAQG
jgi:RNA polymerase sigma-70 factor (ECF subfamily)